MLKKTLDVSLSDEEDSIIPGWTSCGPTCLLQQRIHMVQPDPPGTPLLPPPPATLARPPIGQSCWTCWWWLSWGRLRRLISRRRSGGRHSGGGAGGAGESRNGSWGRKLPALPRVSLRWSPLESNLWFYIRCFRVRPVKHWLPICFLLLQVLRMRPLPLSTLKYLVKGHLWLRVLSDSEILSFAFPSSAQA